MAEWSNAPDSKSGIRFLTYRGFESLSLRQVSSQDAPLGAFFISRTFLLDIKRRVQYTPLIWSF